MLDIYPAREKPMDGVTSQIILDKVSIANKQILSKENLLEELRSKNNLEVLITVGAGDIDTKILDIKNLLLSKSIN